MIIKHMAPEKFGFVVEDSLETQVVVSVLEDGGDEIALIVDTSTSKYYINKIMDKNAIWKFRSTNFAKIESDEAFDAYEQFFYDNGLGQVLDGMRLARTGSLKK